MSTASVADITATPAANQSIQHDGKQYTTIKEGLAYILTPESSSKVPQTSPNGDNQPQAVFYNPIQQFNRDLSVLAIKAYGEEVIVRKQRQLERRQNDLSLKKGKKRKLGGDGEAEEPPEKTARVNGGTSHQNDGTTKESMADGDGKDRSAASNTKADEPSERTREDPAEGANVSHPNEPASVIEEEPTNGNSEDTKSKSPSFTILDALSATGLRALRYAQEIAFTTNVIANDLLPEATKMINLNIQHNKLSDKIQSNTGNAVSHMYNIIGEEAGKTRFTKSRKYDVIDLDPYGTAAPFLDAAVQAVHDGGLLCVTCTDAGVWASNGYPEKAFSLYGGVSIKGLHSHEGGLRLILNSIATSAARYGLSMEPLLSLSIDFYARVFVRIKKSPADVKFLAGKTMIVYNCDSGCGAWTTQLIGRNKTAINKKGTGTFYKHVYAQGPTTNEQCQHCGMKRHLAGPMYAGPLHSREFIRQILKDLPNVSKDTYGTTDRIRGMLSVALEETLKPLDLESSNKVSDDESTKKAEKYDPAAVDEYPFFFIPSAISKVIHCVTPHEDALRGALRHLGYRVTRSHTKPGSIKTDAPWNIIWEIMREWVRQKAPIKEGAVREGTPGYKILKLDRKSDDKDESGDGEVLPEIVFDEELGKETDRKKLVRYQSNPRENWGPMTRARGR